MRRCDFMCFYYGCFNNHRFTYWMWFYRMRVVGKRRTTWMNSVIFFVSSPALRNNTYLVLIHGILFPIIPNKCWLYCTSLSIIMRRYNNADVSLLGALPRLRGRCTLQHIWVGLCSCVQLYCRMESLCLYATTVANTNIKVIKILIMSANF